MSDASDTPGIELADVLAEWFAREREDLHTAFVGRVERYDAVTQTADVLPLIYRPVTSESNEIVYEQLPVLPALPVLTPRAGAAYLHMPVSVGDFVLVTCLESAYRHWRQGDGRAEHPGDLRRHHLAHAVCQPVNLYPAQQALADPDDLLSRITLGYDDGQRVTIAEDRIDLGANATKGIARKDDTTDNGSITMTCAGNVVTVSYTPPGGSTSVVGALTFTSTPLGVVTVVGTVTIPVVGKIDSASTIAFCE